MNELTPYLHRELAFGITVLQLAIFVVGAVVVLWVLKFLARPKVENKITQKQCKSCGWRGPASRTNRQCPKCRAPLYTG